MISGLTVDFAIAIPRGIDTSGRHIAGNVEGEAPKITGRRRAQVAGGEKRTSLSMIRMSALCVVSSHFSCCDWQIDYRPYPGSTAPPDLPRLNRQPEFRPARIQSFERAFALEPRELMAETEVDPCAKSNVAVRPSLEIKLLRQHICCRIHVAGRQHGNDLVAVFQPDATQLDVLPNESRFRELHRRYKAEEFLDR